MTNADKFKHLFGIYATELWAMPESDFLEWLNADAQDMPTVERKTGKWVKAQFVLTSNPPKYVWNCSECGKSVNGYSAVVLTDYCPDCGSYNGGEERNESIHQ